MSYILDALAQSHTAGVEIGLRKLSKRSSWQQAAIGVLLVLVAVMATTYLGVLKQQRTAASQAFAAEPAPMPRTSAVIDEVPAMDSRPAKRAKAPAAVAVVTTAPVEQVIPAAPARPARPAPQVLRAEPRFRPPVALSQPLPSPSPSGPGGAYTDMSPPPAVSPGAVAAAPAVAIVAAPVRMASVSDLKPMSVLPIDTRQAISQMKVRVHFYTPQRRSRFIMIDGRELREGDELFDGVRLEEVTDTGLVLRHNNTLVFSPASPAP